MSWTTHLTAAACLLALLALYIYINDRRLTAIPPAALAVSPTRCTVEDVWKMDARLRAAPVSNAGQIPPRTGRRYIVVGGAGFLGGWIVRQLLDRGEEPRRIRVLDLRPPARADLTTGRGTAVHFMQVDISDGDAVRAAFAAPWPEGAPDAGLTVFHTAANIRFFEKRRSLLPNSARVNVAGTQHVVDAARAAGAGVLVYTSSGSVAVKINRFLLWPWEREPAMFVQAINEDEALVPTRHEQFFSNYAATKIVAERRVRAADKTPSGQTVLRTGCLRPGNGIFGPGGDMLCGAYLVRQVNPTWLDSVVQNFTYVENAAVAHLLYEQRLLELENGGRNPDIGGQAFVIADPGRPPTYGDVYLTLSTLMDGETTFPFLSPTLMILLSHAIECYYLSRPRLVSALPFLKHILPPLAGDLVNLQPPLFNLVNVHLVFDDSRARLPPEKGGLGYKGAWTTFEGLHKTVVEHKRGALRSEQRSDVAGISLGFGLGKAQKAVGRMGKKVEETVGVDPVYVLGST
ncbi:unnamed protein product [Mycena citricolor]|uniref:3-beta hydroxysteroid dehydrogenase/isomerase domain-containing protein n=1 Tax=Mycena citricolor TaxID=2018698 RepID=A0AAD2K0U3_9AGAR|nr:unnamed protein product [Mycena citricolor]